MAITFIGANQAAGTSVSIPAHQAGDLILMFAYRSSSATAPSVPGGTGTWTTVNSSGGNTNSAVVAYRIATASGTTSGTWTNATHLHVLVYRGASQTSPIGGTAVTGASSATITVPALTLQRTDDTSVVVAFHGHRNASTNFGAPTGMTQRSKQGTSGVQSQSAVSNSTVSSWTSRTLSAGGTSSGWRSISLEILDASPQIGLINATLAGGWFDTYDHPVPSGVQDGDVMVLFASANDFDTLTTPPGWTLENRTQMGGACATWVFSKIASSEPANYAMTWNGAHWHRSQMLVFRGFSGLKTLSVASNDSGTTLNMPSVNADAGDMLVGYGFHWSSTTPKSFPTPPTTVLTETANGGGTSVYDLRTTTGPTPTYTFTGSDSTAGRIVTYSVLLAGMATGTDEEASAEALSANVTVTATGTRGTSATASSASATASVTATTGPVGASTSASSVTANASVTATGSVDVSADAGSLSSNATIAATGSMATSSAAGSLVSNATVAATGSVDASATAASTATDVSVTATGSMETSSTTSFGVEVEYVDARTFKGTTSKFLPVKRTDIPQTFVNTAIPSVGVVTSLVSPPIQTRIPTWTVSTGFPRTGISTGLPETGIATDVEDPRTDTIIPDPFLDTHLSEDEV